MGPKKRREVKPMDEDFFCDQYEDYEDDVGEVMKDYTKDDYDADEDEDE